MNPRRVVVTGLGALTPIGNSVSDYWQGLISGKSGSAPITYFDTSDFKTKFACELKNFNPLDFIEKKEIRRQDKFSQYATICSEEAINDSDLINSKFDSNRVGVIWGAGIGGIETFQNEMENFFPNKRPRFNPFFIPKLIADIAPGLISIKYGFRGPNFTTVSACASSSNAIIDALNYIRLGYADVIIAGGSEAAVTCAGVVVAYALGVPFSLGAFIFGVGSVALIGFIKQKSRVKEDTVIGLVFTGFFALGIVLVSKIKSNIDLMHILFGSPLGISLSDIHQTIFISILVVVLLSIFRKDLMLYCFDPRHAKTVGINVGFLHYLLLTCLSLAAVVGLQTVGIVLVVAMLITPGATAYLLTDKFDRMSLISVLSSIVSSVLGIYLSYWFDIETGGSIVLVQTFIFLFAFLFAPRYGMFKFKKLLSSTK